MPSKTADCHQPMSRRQTTVALLKAVSQASAVLANASQFEEGVTECLRLIGTAMDVDRAYIFEGHPNTKTRAFSLTQRAEWCKVGVSAQLDNEATHDLPIETEVPRWYESFLAGRPIRSRIEDLPVDECAVLEGQGIRALLAVPILLEGSLWGIIGFDDCTYGCDWEDDEVEVLVCLAAALGGFIARLRATRALRKSEAFHRSIVENSRDVVFTLDRRGRFQYVSPAWEEIHGTTPEEAIGTSFADVIHPDDVAHCWERIRYRMANPDDARSIDYRVLHADGTYRYNSTRASFMPTEDGSDANLVGVAGDVTERQLRENELVRLAEALAQARDEALAASEAKGRFLATMSHELRTPLNGVIGTTSLMLDLELSAEARELVETIHASGETLVRVINDILDFSKIEAGRLEIERTPVEVPDLVNDVVALYRGHANSRGLRLSALGPRGCPAVLADPVRLKQILGNLVSNALKFTQEGSVRVAWGVRWEGEEALILFDVSDTGIGIPDDRLQRIFAPFDQGDPTVQRRFGGTGLGLAISHRLVELMGGGIGVHSQPNVGSTFSVQIRCPVVAETPEAEEVAEVAIVGKLNVLLAEDNPVNVKVAGRVLSRLGCRFDVARDGMEAIRLALASDYDVILMDVQMPGCDGIEATRAIRAHESARGGHRRIVAVTANAMESDRLECSAAGMDGFLAKPFTLDQVRICLSSHRD